MNTSQQEQSYCERVESIIVPWQPPVEQDINHVQGPVDKWPEPQPLIAKVVPDPYPLEALPAKLRAAVEEVQGFTKAPIPLIVASALSALSLVTQGHVNVQRSQGLSGPASLYSLVIAPSGERKSTIDDFFTKAIWEYQRDQREIGKPLLQEYQALFDTWTQVDAGIKDSIRQREKNGEPYEDLKAKLVKHKKHKPVPPMIPELLYADATMESLRRNLANVWPSAGLMSAEGGEVFGSHSLNGDSTSRTLSQMNKLWDGGILKVTRMSSAESVVIENARLTVGIMIQEEALKEFLDKSGTLARGNGFFARCLLSIPESTQGNRPFTKKPSNWPAMNAFNRQITATLNREVNLDDNGNLVPALMKLSPEAEDSWIKYANDVELELRYGGDLHAVKDIASKSADNAARLAALLEVFEHGLSDTVSLESMQAAEQIALWHLSESRRFFGEVALPAELSNMVRLDTWLVRHCNETGKTKVAKNHVRQTGSLRDAKSLDGALNELVSLDRIRLRKIEGKQTIEINPNLLGVA